MSLGKVPMKAGGGAKQNASIKQGTQVSTATQRAATTTRHRHTEKLSGDMKWYMKCFIHWTVDLKSSKPWSSQLWKPEKVRTSTGFEPVTWRYQCDALTNWAMKPLTLRAGHLWVLMSPRGMDVKWYMKCFIYWTADLKSSKPWSSQF